MEPIEEEEEIAKACIEESVQGTLMPKLPPSVLARVWQETEEKVDTLLGVDAPSELREDMIRATFIADSVRLALLETAREEGGF